MSKKSDDPSDSAESPATEPASTPLFSASIRPTRLSPVIDTDESCLYALEGSARRLVTDGGCDSYDGTVTGLLGENALAQFLPIDARPDTAIYDDGDGGFDFRFRGATIDVKTVGRHREEPALTVDAYQSLTADYYVLAQRIGPTSVRLIGYAPRKFVANQIRHYDGQPYHYVDQQYLFPFPPSL